MVNIYHAIGERETLGDFSGITKYSDNYVSCTSVPNSLLGNTVFHQPIQGQCC